MNTMNLNLSQKQELKITAELRQAIEMLTLNALEVQDMVAREMAENPLLEVEAAGDGAADGEGREEGSWEESWDNWAIRDEGASGPAATPTTGGGTSEDSDAWQNMAAKSDSLTDHVRKQYDELVTDGKLRLVGQFLIDSLDDSGYLRADLSEVAKKLGVTDETVDDARALIQSLHPAGVGARDLSECLRLQLHALGLLDPVTEVCVAHLDWVAAREWPRLAREANCTPEQVMLALQDIQQCNPKPGLAFGGSRVEVVIPRRAGGSPSTAPPFRASSCCRRAIS
jgi:RNA polymerase sigma-54 factor